MADPMPWTTNLIDPASPPVFVEHPVMKHRWELLTFLHWSYDAAAVQALLPEGLTVETWEDSAWVGLVPFYMRVAGPVGPELPWAGQFCETNVRTYVRDSFGRSGIWFFSLDAGRLPVVAVARSTYRLPYFWSRLRLGVRGDRVAYSCSRLWPGPPAKSRVIVELGEMFRPDELTLFDHFLTARWNVYSVVGRQLIFTRASHQPWPLRRASVVSIDDTLLTAAGLPAPIGDPLVHYSPGVAVRLSGPERSKPGP